VTRPTDRQSSY